MSFGSGTQIRGKYEQRRVIERHIPLMNIYGSTPSPLRGLNAVSNVLNMTAIVYAHKLIVFSHEETDMHFVSCMIWKYFINYYMHVHNLCVAFYISLCLTLYKAIVC